MDSVRALPQPDGCPPPVAPDDLIAPGYRVVAHLRRGADLDVYDVWSEERLCRCIAKVVRPDRSQNRSTCRRLLREGQVLERLTHPHLVRAYSTRTQPAPMVILETLPGATLGYLVRKFAVCGRRLPIGDVVLLGIQISSAVQYLHRHGLLHLDLKPSNIVVHQGLTKVLDLSLVRPPGRTRTRIGTPIYLAPEQVRGGVLTTASDMWGIGIVLFVAATGKQPFGNDPNAYLQFKQPAPPVGRVRRMPARLAKTIDRCLAPDPVERPTVMELVSILESFA